MDPVNALEKLAAASFKIRFTAEAQRSQREMFIQIQSGDADWI